MKNSMKKLSYWIKERNNPQFDKPYYVGLGQRTKASINESKKSVGYGSNHYCEYKNEVDYRNRINELKNSGYSVSEQNF
jgi:hypothetical protein